MKHSTMYLLGLFIILLMLQVSFYSWSTATSGSRLESALVFAGDNREKLEKVLSYYYSQNGWGSLGQQVAECEELIYNNAPAHALFWLRNLTRGKYVFLYQDNYAKYKYPVAAIDCLGTGGISCILNVILGVGKYTGIIKSSEI